MNLDARILVAGAGGMVGSALVRALKRAGYVNLLVPDRGELDCRTQSLVNSYFSDLRPDYAFVAAAKVGGIAANASRPAEFLYDNLAIESNLIHAAYLTRVRKLLFLGSTCIYPKLAPQPLKEEYLMTGALEETNQWYAIAKIAGIRLCQAYRRQYGCDFVAAMPTNLYGPRDNFDLDTSHVMPALIRKLLEGQEAGSPSVSVWGSGRPLREFLHVDDCAEACLFLMNRYSGEQHVNVGVGHDLSIRQLAELIASIVNYRGTLSFDSSKPDGTPRKLVDVSRINALGWYARIGLEEGIRDTCRWYRESRVQGAIAEEGLR